MSLEVQIIIYNSSKGYPPAFVKNIQVENAKDLTEKVVAIYEGVKLKAFYQKI